MGTFVMEHVVSSDISLAEEIELTDLEEESEKEHEQTEKEKKEFFEDDLRTSISEKTSSELLLEISSGLVKQACLELITPPPEC